MQSQTFDPREPVGTGLDFQSAYDAYRWAEELFALRRYAEAATTLERLVAAHPEDRDLGAARELLARCYFHTAQLGRATALAREILDRDPTDAYATLLLARSLERASETEEAGAVRRVLDALEPGP